MRKKYISLGLVTALLLSLSGKGVSYAMTNLDVQNQSVESETGYRLYAADLTSTSGIIKGDVTNVLPENEIFSVRLPDGSISLPNEVNYPITESGDYTFEIIYEAPVMDSNSTEEITNQEISEENNSDNSIESIEEIESTENIESKEVSEENSIEEQDITVTETEKQTKSETLTLTVTLPEVEKKAETEADQEEIQSEDTGKQESTTRSNASTSIQSNSSVSTQSIDGAGWDTEFDFYGSRLNWTRDRFKSYTTYWGSTGGMSYAGNDQSLTNGITTNYRQGDNGYALSSAATPTFRWGYYNRTSSTYNWIQYSQGFSDISVNLSKDFALGGTMTIGDAFGSLDTNSEGAKRGYAGLGGTGLIADGGLTISLLPTGRQDEIIASSSNGLSGVQRLGAYGVFKDAIIMEFDVGHQNGYASITGSNASSFHIMNSSEELKRVGDYRIYNDDLKGLGLSNYANTFYDKYQYPAVASQSHIGISVTGANGYVNSEDRTSQRRFIWGGDTGSFDYKIEYRASEGKMYYSVRHTGKGTWEYVTECTIPQEYRNKQYTVASSFSAIYQDSTKFTSSGGYFNGATNANNGSGIGPGQMELTIQGVYSQPSLDNLNNQVAFMKDNKGSLNEGSTSVKAYQQGYVSGSETDQTKQDKRKYFPIEGDKIVIQNQANVSALFNETGITTGNINLTSINFRDLKFVDSNGSTINGIPKGLNISSINDIGISYYYSVNGGSTWTQCNKNNSLNAGISSSGSEPLRWRIVITLPETSDITDSTNKQFWLTGETVLTVSRGGATATFNLPWVKENSKKVTFFSDPKDVGVNNLGKNTARVIAANDISTLYGNKTSVNKDAVSYGLNVWYNSTQRNESYDPANNGQNQTYEYKSIEQILNSSASTQNNTADQNINLSEDTRYIVTYSLYDSVFNTGGLSKLPDFTGNKTRAQATTKRVIWKSDNVKVENGYEFYMEPEVTLSLEDFKDFDNGDKPTYYRKIADAANVAVFKTSNTDWVNLARDEKGNIKTNISGNGSEHSKISNLIKNPGTSDSITIRFTDGNQIVDKTIKITFAPNTPKVVSNVKDWDDKSAEKIIFDKENYTVSATFKLVNSDGSDINQNNFNWNEVKNKINVALYKKNGPAASGSKDKFYRWANKDEADHMGQVDNIPKLNLPASLYYNDDGTFTVTYTLLNKSGGSNSDWIAKNWENDAQWKILAWTDSNNPSKNYSNLTDSATDSIGVNDSDSNVPSVTTTIKLIEKDNNNLPSTMFVISDVKLSDNGTELVDKRNTTSITLKNIEGVKDMNKVQHIYYYDVSVNESKADNQNRPYTVLTQSGTNRQFNATYLKYDEKNKTYSDITKTNLLLGSISYPSDNTYPSTLRFGMRADQQKNLTSTKSFEGSANFKFERKTFSGGVNP